MAYILFTILAILVLALFQAYLNVKNRMNQTMNALLERQSIKDEETVRLKELVESINIEALKVEFFDKIATGDASLFETNLKCFKDKFNEKMTNLKKEFDKELEKKHKEACDAIDFSEITYKKTITQKRKAYVRKNQHKAKPVDDVRSIDAE